MVALSIIAYRREQNFFYIALFLLRSAHGEIASQSFFIARGTFKRTRE